MNLVPMSVQQAKQHVARWHRHLPNMNSGLFAVGVAEDGAVRGVGIVGNPPRPWQGTGRCVITRCATDGFPNACSMVYGALSRAAKALGYVEVWTYTLPGEDGASLRAAGFEDRGMTRGNRHWNTPSRPREPSTHPEAKRRWCRRLA